MKEKSHNLVFFFACTARLVGCQFPDQGLNPCHLQWKHGALTTGWPGNSLHNLFRKLTEDILYQNERLKREVPVQQSSGGKSQDGSF